MILRAFIAASVLLMTTPAHATDCPEPPQAPPDLPDGETAGRDDMLDAQRAVKSHSTEVNAYLDCLDTNRDMIFQLLDKDQQARWIEDYQNTVDRLRTLEEGYNIQVRAFNRRRAEAGS